MALHLIKMHLLKTLVVSLLPIAALAAKKPAVDTYERYYTKSLSSTPLKLDDSVYGKLTSAPRDYSVAVLLTALETRFGCQLCREFQPEWDLISKSWTKGDKQGESRLLFGTLDFMDGKGTFQAVCLALQIYNLLILITDSLAFKLLPSFSSFLLQLALMPLQSMDP